MKRTIVLKESELISLIKDIIKEAETTATGTDNKFGFALIFAFPEMQIKGYGGETITKRISRTIHGGDVKGSYGKLGHAGVALVDSNGYGYLFEFGRYGTPQGYGRVIFKQLGKIGKIEMQKGMLYGSTPKLVNAKQVAQIVKSNSTEPNEKMNVAVVRIPDFKKAYDFAKITDMKKYAEIDVTEGGAMNCGTYANDVVNAGGITNLSPVCSPYPNQIVQSFRPAADEYFTV